MVVPFKRAYAYVTNKRKAELMIKPISADYKQQGHICHCTNETTKYKTNPPTRTRVAIENSLFPISFDSLIFEISTLLPCKLLKIPSGPMSEL